MKPKARPSGTLARQIIGALRDAGRPMTYAELSAVAGYPLSAGKQIPQEVVRVAAGWYGLRDFDLTGWRPPTNHWQPPAPPTRHPRLPKPPRTPRRALTRPPAPPTKLSLLTPEIRALLQEWLQDVALQGRSANTISNYRHFATAALQGLPDLASLTPAWIRQWAHRRMPQVKATTVRTELVTLQIFCAWLMGEGRIDSNPAEKVPKPTSKKKPHRFLTGDELRALWGAAADDAERLWLLLLLNGLRRHEVAALRWENFDQQRMALRLTVTKGSKARPVPVSPLLAQLLHATRRPDGELPRVQSDALYRRFKRIAKRAGVPDVHPHLLRHSFASHAVQLGAPTLALQHVGGWADAKMVEHYSESVQEDAALESMRSLNVAERLIVGDDPAPLLAPDEPPDVAALVDAVLANPVALALLFARLGDQATRGGNNATA